MARKTSAFGNQKVLVVSNTCEPMTYVNIEDAAEMLYSGRVQRGTIDDIAVLHSVRSKINVPHVIIRVRPGIPKRYRTVPLNRKNLLIRDHNTCQYCGQVGGKLEIEHIIPKSRGGELVWTNVVAACRSCNSFKAGRTPAEAGMTLRGKAYEPSRIWWMRRGKRPEDLHPEVRPYLFALY